MGIAPTGNFPTNCNIILFNIILLFSHNLKVISILRVLSFSHSPQKLINILTVLKFSHSPKK